MLCKEIMNLENFPINCCEALITDSVCSLWFPESTSYSTGEMVKWMDGGWRDD